VAGSVFPDADLTVLQGKRLGFVLTGSFCTFRRVLKVVERLVSLGASVQPVLSYASATHDTRFIQADELAAQLTRITGNAPWAALQQVEPIGPKRLVDLTVVAPATGNTLAKLASGLADTPATLAVKSTLRNGAPVLLAVSTNDGLAGAAKNIGALLARKHFFFVPFGQDDPAAKPTSLVADMERVPEAAAFALQGKQIQPMLYGYCVG